jgi:hypothetical protein
MCRGKLCENLSEREDWSPEAVVDLEFVNKSAAPKPEFSLNHDDWVSACRFAIQFSFVNGSFKYFIMPSSVADPDHRIHMFFGLPDPLFRSMDPSIMQK